MNTKISSVLIIGLGLIGGSLAKRFKEKQFTVFAVDPDEFSLEKAKAEKVIDKGETALSAELCKADAILVCTPVSALKETFFTLSTLVSPDTLIFDCASVNGLPCTLAEEAHLSRFVSLHPMAGSEQGGFSGAKAHLFENAYLVITPSKSSDPYAVDVARFLCQKLGSIPLILDAETHDRYAAVISHLPHVVSASLVHLMERSCNDETLSSLAAGSFRDLTRISSSPPNLWRDISLANKKELDLLLKSLEQELSHFRELLANQAEEDVLSFFASAKAGRDKIEARPFGTLNQLSTITVDVIDTIGILAEITRLLGDAAISISNIGISNSREHEGGVLTLAFADRYTSEKATKLLSKSGHTVHSPEK